ncbi:MAG TPA: hypothetical protein DCP61_06225 [Treponema sp.]|nr:hypothetical protein [Treponema sp.]
MQKVSATLNLRKYSPFFFLPTAGVYGKCIKQGMQCRKSEGGSTGMEAENAAKKQGLFTTPSADTRYLTPFVA